MKLAIYYRVTCRQLGYDDGKPTHHGAFGVGTGKVWLYEVECTGTESRLVDCPHSGDWDIDWAYHEEDAGVVCYNGSDDTEAISKTGKKSPEFFNVNYPSLELANVKYGRMSE